MRRLIPFVIIILVALVTLGVATTLYRSKMRPPESKAASAAATAAEGSSPAAAMAEEDQGTLHVRGPRNAPVTLEIYGDFQCPSCAMNAMVVDDLQKQYGDKLRVIFHEFPLAMHPHAMEAAMAAEAAALQGRFWEMHDMIYRYQNVWSQATTVSHFFATYAESIGLDTARFRADAQNPDVRARVVADGAEGEARGVKNTPTIFINGRLVQGGFRKEVLEQAVENALAQPKKS